MKLKKFEIAAVAVSLAAVVFAVGFFIGRGTSGGDVIISPGTGVSSPADDYTEEDFALSEDKDENKELQDEKKNINTVGADELEKLPGIGSVLAQRIIEYRENVGYFEKTEDIMNVEGIGRGKYDDIRDLITIS